MDQIILSAEVSEALAAGAAVVALESTIITHGMPYPTNVSTALAVEGIVRNGGAVPATIGVIDGGIHVGMDGYLIEKLARSPECLKLSSADLPYAVARRRSGGTTVAATLKIAELAGIRVFATGGIGGVHRGAEVTFDVSADLAALASTRVVVVCAGPKAILDIGATLEKLESLQVAVLGFKTDQLPAFYYQDSGFPVGHRMDSAEEVARFVAANSKLRCCGGPLVVVPVPEVHALDRTTIETAIADALEQAKRQGIRGKEVTPYLLAAVKQLSDGASLETNVALIKNNALVATEIACAIRTKKQS